MYIYHAIHEKASDQIERAHNIGVQNTKTNSQVPKAQYNLLENLPSNDRAIAFSPMPKATP